jgi:plasmid replication initiation protein
MAERHSPESEETSPSGGALIPERYPQHELFLCDVSDAILKDIMQDMEHPFYSLSKKPERTIRRYQHNGATIEITPSVKGLATIYDKDILIYCISKVMAGIRRGEAVGKQVEINSRELLQFTNRGTAGKDYKALCEALDRLDGTRIRTNIRSGQEEQFDAFGLIDAASLRRKFGLDGRLLWCRVTLSDWVFNAIQANEVLTLHRDYFRLRKPLERRIYELARKHCGAQPEWRIGLQGLLKKSGSQSSIRRFRQMTAELAASDHLPDYHVAYERDRDHVVFTGRGTITGKRRDADAGEDRMDRVRLATETYKKASEAAPGWDVYQLEQVWRDWAGDAPPKHPDQAFIGFCRRWYERRGPAR